MQFWVTGGGTILAEAGYTVVRSPLYCGTRTDNHSIWNYNCIPNAWLLQYLEKVHAERPQSASEPRTFMLRGDGVAHHDADASLMEDIYSPVYQTVIRIAEIWQRLRPAYYWELQRELPSLTIKCNARWYCTTSFAHTLPAEIFLSTLCLSLHLFFGDIFPPGS